MENTLYVDVSDEQVRCFQDQGFLRLNRMTTDAELAWLRNVYDEIVKKKTGYPPQELDQLNAKRNQGSLLTVPSPENIILELKDTIFYCKARKAFSRLLGGRENQLLYGWRIFCNQRIVMRPRGTRMPRIAHLRTTA